MNDQPHLGGVPHPVSEAAGEEPGFTPSHKLGAALDDAETLLKFAAVEGITIPPDVLGPIVEARIKYGRSTFEKSQLIEFFSSLSILSSLLKPVTANSVRACESEATKKKLRRDRASAVFWTVVTLVISAIAFVNHSFSSRIDQDVTSANQLAVQLRSGIGPNPSDAVDPCHARQSGSTQASTLTADRLTMLQHFAATTRDVYKESLKFNFLIPGLETDPFNEADRADLELHPAVLNFQAEVFCKITLFEKARDFSRNVVLDNGFVYGVISQFVLPVLYSIVGAYAFRLRSFSETVRNYTYHPSYADSARMIGAFIVGSVIGLFNLFTETVSLSPLAIAFLAGYAVEVFFALLDSLVQTVGKREGSPSTKSVLTIIHSSPVRTGSVSAEQTGIQGAH